MTIYNTLSKEGVDIAAVFTLDTSTPEYPAAPFAVGEVCLGSDGSSFNYCTQTTATIVAGAAVFISPTAGSWTVTKLLTSNAGAAFGNAVGVVAAAVAAISGTQTGQFFWVQRAGNVPSLVGNGVGTVNKALVTTTTAGQLTNLAVAATTYTVPGIIWAATTGTAAGASAGAVANYPTVGAVSA